MNNRLLCLLPLCLLIIPASAMPRDAEAVLNRCGTPLRGDETVYENSVAGGRRVLSFERSTLNFDRVANSGWSFTYGTHGGSDHLNADQMSGYMPCLRDALADSASPHPLTRVTAMDRAEVSLKRSLKQVIVGTFGFLIVLAGIFVAWSRWPRSDEGLVG